MTNKNETQTEKKIENYNESDMNRRQHGMMKCIYCGKRLKRLSPRYNATRYSNSNSYAFSNCHRKCFEEQRGKD